jgi:hypothetical protein
MAPGVQERAPGSFLWCWLILLGLMLWNVVSFWPANERPVAIPYTTFLGEVYPNNVFRFRIVGDETSRPFAKPHLLAATPERIIGEDAQHLLAERHEAVFHLLEASRQQLNRLVQVLLERETVGPEALITILGPRLEMIPNSA